MPALAMAIAESVRIPAKISAHSESRNGTSGASGEKYNFAMTQASVTQWLVDQNAGPTLKNLPDGLLEKNSHFALRARQEIAPARDISQDIFLRDVLPFRQLDEPVDDWREVFFSKLLPVARGKATLREVADAVIPFVFDGLGDKKIEFKGNSTPAKMAPLSETLASGSASCTGLSILVTDALRAVGVPARVVGTPEWNLPTGGNHNWVEVYLGDGWHYIDAVPTKKVEWDNAWFTAQNAQLATAGGPHGIYSSVWDRHEANAHYPLTWREPPVMAAAIDRTGAYTSMAKSAWNPQWAPYRDASENLR